MGSGKKSLLHGMMQISYQILKDLVLERELEEEEEGEDEEC